MAARTHGNQFLTKSNRKNICCSRGKLWSSAVELFFGRKFAVCLANPQLSFMAKRQKSSGAAAQHFPLHSIYFLINFIKTDFLG